MNISSKGHEEIKKYVQLVAAICISDNFLTLKRELEVMYQKSGTEQVAMQAFQDALYAILAEEEIEYLNQRAY